MTDKPAVNVKEANLADGLNKASAILPVTPASQRTTRLARAISNILSPSVVSVPMVLLVAFYRATSTQSAIVYAAITFFFLSVGPLIYIVIGVRLGRLSDLDVSKRSERFVPFFFSLLSVCLGGVVLVLAHAPASLITVVIAVAISGAIMMIITLWWKISIHASSLAGVATILAAFYGVVMLPAFLLVILVSWSRVVLRRHTIAQVAAGSLLSIVLITLILKLRGF
jgi:membrane-associated phospholipid phosphatase